jgi:hypothetical protein
VDSDGTHRKKAAQSKSIPGECIRHVGPLVPPAPRPPFRQADALISLAENQIDLLRRCQPRNEAAAAAAWLAARRRGERRELALRHAPPPALGSLRAALERAAEQLAGAGAIGRLYAERASELELEARLAEHIGQPGFARLARLRHAEGAGPEWQVARRRARGFCELPAGAAHEPLHAAHDRRCPDSLANVLAREIGRRRLPLRLELVPALASVAACGDGVN